MQETEKQHGDKQSDIDFSVFCLSSPSVEKHFLGVFCLYPEEYLRCTNSEPDSGLRQGNVCPSSVSRSIQTVYGVHQSTMRTGI